MYLLIADLTHNFILVNTPTLLTAFFLQMYFVHMFGTKHEYIFELGYLGHTLETSVFVPPNQYKLSFAFPDRLLNCLNI